MRGHFLSRWGFSCSLTWSCRSLPATFTRCRLRVAFVIASIVAIGISKGGKLTYRIEPILPGSGKQQHHADGLDFHPCRRLCRNRQSDGSRRRIGQPHDVAAARKPVGDWHFPRRACFISLSVGTSVGTIVALAPVAVGIVAKRRECAEALMLGGRQ